MDLKNFKIKSESEDSYHIIHPSGKTMTVMKKNLHPKAHALIQKFVDGGQVQDPMSVLEEAQKNDVDTVAPGSEEAANQALSNLQNNSVSNAANDFQSAQADFQKAQEAAKTDNSLTAKQDLMRAQENLNQAKGTLASVAQNQAQQGTIPPRAQAVPSDMQGINAQASIPGQQQLDPYLQSLQSQSDLLAKEQQDIQNYSKGIDVAGAQQQGAYQNLINKQSQLQTPQQIADSYKQKDDALMQHFMDSKIDPNRYLHNMSTGSKILSAIGLIFSGAGAGAHGVNLASQQIQNSINNDIAAQQNDQSKAFNLWKMNRENMQSDIQANVATQNQLLTAAQAKVALSSANLQNAQAKLQAQQLINDLEQKKIQNRQLLASSGQGGAAPSGFSNIDPAILIPKLVPTEHQKEAFAQVQAAQNTVRMGNAIKAAFEQAANENTVLKTGAGLLRTPGSVYALHQAMQPTFSDLEGTVRQAAMDNTFRNVTPAPGDSEHTIETKRNALNGYLQSKMSAPIPKAYGIDLNNFSTTSTNPVARLTPQQQQYYTWAKANPNNPKAQLVLKKLGVQ